MPTAKFNTNGSLTTDQVVGLPNTIGGLGETGPLDLENPVDLPIDSQMVVDARGPRFFEGGHPSEEEPTKERKHWLRWIILTLIIALAIGLFIRYGLPAIHTLLTTESTDDAFVMAHRTNVSPRVPGVVTAVFLDQNDRVEPGMLLALIDRRPYEVALAQAEAALLEAKAELDQARAQARSQLAMARGNWFRRRSAREQLNSQLSRLRAEVATLKANQSDEVLAQVDQHRIANLVRQGSATQGELDIRNNTLDVARERVKEAWATINAIRAAVGLEPDEANPLRVPPDLLEQQSTIQSAVSDVAEALAELGIEVDEKTISEAEVFDKIMSLNFQPGEADGIDAIIERAPAIQVARAKVDRAEKEVDDAKLQLEFTEIRSEIAGHVQDRSVNPGDRVAPGQTLISIRPDYVWIAANFKETQIDDIWIGQPVDLYVDAYPGKVFQGRVAGFSPGTGLSQSLLPPENATGNYVKVTQRLPVRIELVEPNPADTPLFAGLSVRPYVHIDAEPTGPRAGERLRGTGRPRPEDIGAGPAGSSPGNQASTVSEALP